MPTKSYLDYDGLIQYDKKLLERFGVHLTVTIPLSSWTDKSVTIRSNIFKTDSIYDYFIGPEASSKENRNHYYSCGIWAKDITVDGELTFITDSMPLRDISVHILRLGVYQ